MISKHVSCEPEHDDYARLAAYIADAGHDGEKCLMSWHVGCWSEDDYALAVLEAETVQALNTRTTKEKTYHLLVSFRPEDEAKLTPEAFKAIEERFAAALGFTEHQRHCGVHKNTNNIHLHIAYNRIHPEHLTRHDPYYDYKTLSSTCRQLEQEYGLMVDNGFERANENSLSHKAATLEARTGQESFEGYAKRHKSEIMQALEQVKDWQGLHEGLKALGLGVKHHGNGLVFHNLHSKDSQHAVKASAVDRTLSAKRLQERFGEYRSYRNLRQIQEVSRYQATPLHLSPERGELYAKYQTGIETRRTRLQSVKEREDTARAAIRQQWEAKRREIEQMSIAKRNRRNLLALARKHEAEALAKAKLEFQPEREAARRKVPYTSWSGFLRHEAERGNEIALAVLRSLKEAVQPEQALEPTQGQVKDTAPPAKDWSKHGLEYATTATVKADFATQQRAVLEREDLSGKGKTRLLAVLRMEELAAEEQARSVNTTAPPLFTGVLHRIDNKGTVIFTLSSGGTVRDTGKEVLFSAHDKAAGDAARQYAVKKWGKGLRLEGNTLRRDVLPERDGEPERVQEREQQKRRGMER